MPQDVFPPEAVPYSAPERAIAEPEPGLVRACALVYLLYGIGIFLHGIPLLFGMPPFAIVLYLVGGAIAYMRSEDAKSTWAESHIILMKKLFWVTAVVSAAITLIFVSGVVGSFTMLLKGAVASGFIAGFLTFLGILGAGAIYVLWFAYWNIKGWLRLSDRRAV